ncbi:integrase catalytic domain-containing protein [Trichonephila clavipes]|nr:integrase catalytic domain-containing protein [Trichonephila clavipes]
MVNFLGSVSSSRYKNQNLTGAQKLQYLKGVLKGDAQKIVQSLPITDGNFQIAWDLLKERYFHKREILSSLMKKLMNISPITCESHAQILKLVDSTKECVRLLETLDLKVEGTADIILMFIIQFKLDSTTRGWWERSLDNEKFLRSASFYNFFRIMLDHL